VEWADVEFVKGQLGVPGSEGHVTSPKGGRLRYVPLMQRLRMALKATRHLQASRVLCEGRAATDAEGGAVPRQATGTPLSASFKIPTISVSLNFDFRMTAPDLTSAQETWAV
jgi:hypothetical protein